MATFTATNADDSGPGSLRQAILAANATAGAHTIVFDAAVFDGEAKDIIRLTSGELLITETLTIVGGPAGVTITGDANGDDVTRTGGITDIAASRAEETLGDNSPIFRVNAPLLRIEGLTLTGGHADPSDSENRGGAIYADSRVEVVNSTIAGNGTSGDFAPGGGIWGYAVQVENSTVSGNSAIGVGSRGGGIFGGEVELVSSTVTGNAAAIGGGVVGLSGLGLTDSIVLGNTAIEQAPEAQFASIWASGLNLVGADPDVFGPNGTTILNADPALVFAETEALADGVVAGVLAQNGGPVPTVALKATALNPALDASLGGTVEADARGVAAVDLPGIGASGSGAAVRDLGAYELDTTTETPSLVVNLAADVSDPFDGLTSLREAVAFANATPGADTITFDAAVFDGEAVDVIRLTQGQIAVTEALTIIGGPNGVLITGDRLGDDVTDARGVTDVDASREGADRLADNSRIFDATADLALESLTLTGGSGPEFGGAVRVVGGDLALTNILVAGNFVVGDGGGASVRSGSVTLTDSTVADNRSFPSGLRDIIRGGGIESDGSVSAIRSTIDGNIVRIDGPGGSYGGGISASDVTLTDSTVSDNHVFGGGESYAAFGGGVFGGSVTAIRSTIEGNSTNATFAVTRGGGIFGGNVTLTDSTVSDNHASANRFANRSAEGGGVHAQSAELTNTTIFGNTVSGEVTLGGGLSVGSATVTNSTITQNKFAGTGLFAGVAIFASSEVHLTDSIVAANGLNDVTGIRIGRYGSYSVPGVPSLSGGNIIGGALNANFINVYQGSGKVGETTPDDVFVLDLDDRPLLADNGGPVHTVALSSIARNPAIDAGTDATAADARGVAAFDQPYTPGPGARDLGAFEVADVWSLVVTTASDVVDPNDGLTSLREAVITANGKPGADTVTFDPTVFDGELRDVIRLTGGVIRITEDLVIEGGPAGVTITGDADGDDVTLEGGITDLAASLQGEDRLDDNSRIFFANPRLGVSLDLGIRNLTLTGGVSDELISFEHVNNAFFNTRLFGGAVFGRFADIEVTDSTIAGNFADQDGGGIYGRDVTLTRSAVWGNVGGNGGGIDATNVALTNSTVWGNTARKGENVQFQNDFPEFWYHVAVGGGINAIDTVSLTNSTVSGNVAYGNRGSVGGAYGSGGGINVEGRRSSGSSGTLNLTDSIVLGNAATDAASGDYFVSAIPFGPYPSSGAPNLTGGNILGRNGGGGAADVFSGATDVGDTNSAAVFAETLTIAGGVVAGKLADNGGPVVTVALRLANDNPALGAAGAGAPATDARGVLRDAAPDLGAYEAPNPAPVAAADAAATDENVAVAIAVLANDTDVNGGLDPASVRIEDADAETDGRSRTVAGEGVWTVDAATGVITFTPETGFDGPATPIAYTVADTLGARSDPAAVTVTIGTAPNQPPVAENDQVNTGFETALIIDVLANDSDPDGNLDPTTVSIVGEPTRGTATVNPDGTITYTPNPGESGDDSFTYTVADNEGAVSDPATVTVTIGTAPNQPPVAENDQVNTAFETALIIDVLANDSDPDGNLDPTSVTIVDGPTLGTATVNPDGTITYTPNPGESGEDTFTYTVEDNQGGISNVATVTIAITPPDAPPNLITGTDGDDRIIGSENDDIVFGFAGNDRLEGRGGNDIVFGGRGNDRLSGGPGDDILVGGPGNDILEGGPGLDIAVFAGDFAEYRIVRAGPRVQVQDRGGNNEGNDALTAIEILQFDDGYLDLGNSSFSAGYANERVEALMTRPDYSTDPDPTFVASISVAQVEGLVTESETTS